MAVDRPKLKQRVDRGEGHEVDPQRGEDIFEVDLEAGQLGRSIDARREKHAHVKIRPLAVDRVAVQRPSSIVGARAKEVERIHTVKATRVLQESQNSVNGGDRQFN